MVVSLAFLYNFWVIIYRFAFREIDGKFIVVFYFYKLLKDFKNYSSPFLHTLHTVLTTSDMYNILILYHIYISLNT